MLSGTSPMNEKGKQVWTEGHVRCACNSNLRSILSYQTARRFAACCKLDNKREGPLRNQSTMTQGSTIPHTFMFILPSFPMRNPLLQCTQANSYSRDTK